ncbi:MAG: hypothetical protein N2C14_20110, partial [Planctomycetales bacterium]
AAIIAGTFFSYSLPWLYEQSLASNASVNAILGAKLNFMHSVFLAAILSAVIHVVVSLLTKAPDKEQSQLTWTELGGHEPKNLWALFGQVLASIGLFAAMGAAVAYGQLGPPIAAVIGAGWTLALYVINAVRHRANPPKSDGEKLPPIWLEDRLWAGLLAAVAVFMMFYFF